MRQVVAMLVWFKVGLPSVSQIVPRICLAVVGFKYVRSTSHLSYVQLRLIYNF